MSAAENYGLSDLPRSRRSRRMGQASAGPRLLDRPALSLAAAASRPRVQRGGPDPGVIGVVAAVAFVFGTAVLAAEVFGRGSDGGHDDGAAAARVLV